MKRTRNPLKKALALALAVATTVACPASLAQAPAASGDNVEQVRKTVLNLIRALVDQGVITAAKAQEMLRQAGMDPAALAEPQVTQAVPPAGAEPPKPVVRVPYVPEVVKDQIRDEVKQEVLAQARAERWGEPGALPPWLDRISFYGDVKIRFQSDRYDSSNDPFVQQINAAFGQPQGTITDSTENRDRMRVRGRLGVDAKVADTVEAGARIVTTAASEDQYNPTSEYFDAGQSNQRYGAAIDLTFLRWNILPSVSLSGGRVANPYIGTDLVWAPNTTFDSAVLQWNPRLSQSWTGFATLGAHWLLSTSSSPGVESRNTWLYSLQAGANANWADHSTFTGGAAYYDFYHIEGELNPALPAGNSLYANSAVPYRKPGNTTFNINFLSNLSSPLYALAPQYRLLDLYTHYEWGRFDPLRIGGTAEFVRNVGFNAQEITNRIGLAAQALPTDNTGATGLQRPRVIGFLAEFQIGASSIVRRGDWNAFIGYRRLERDSVVAELTSADYRLGGTDQTAEYVGFSYGLARNTALIVHYIAAKSLDLAPQYNIDTWLVDVQASF